MVPTSPWNKIVIIGVSLTSLLFLHALWNRPQPDLPRYAAQNEGIDLAVVDGITKANAQPLPQRPIRAVIVPHHLIATQAIALGVRALTPLNPRLIVLISPDHFGKCSKIVCTTRGTFSTFFGEVTVNDQAVRALLTHKDIVATSELFKNEHGIYSITPYISHYIPEAQILPIVVSQKGVFNKEIRADITNAISEVLKPNDVALVVSSDFSHYLPLTESNTMDEKTTRTFCAGSPDELLTLNNPSQSDCPMCLWIMHEQAVRGNFWHPSIIWHSNSANLLKDTSVKETTSHFTYIFSNDPSDTQCRLPISDSN